jgi:hypothetical protein
MKKLLAILAGGALIALLAACDISSYFKPKSGQQTQQQPSEAPPPDAAPPPAQPPATEPPAQAAPPPTQPATPPPAQQPTQPKHQTSQPPSQPNYQEPPRSNYPPPSNQQGTNPNYPPPSNQGGYNQPSGTDTGYGQSNNPQAKLKKGGLGVIFTGNLPQGQFRVKVDQTLVYELAFSGSETRATKELLVEPGQHLIRFAVVDANGVRGIKEETFNIKSGTHQTVRVSVKDTPGAIIVEHLE